MDTLHLNDGDPSTVGRTSADSLPSANHAGDDALARAYAKPNGLVMTSAREIIADVDDRAINDDHSTGCLIPPCQAPLTVTLVTAERPACLTKRFFRTTEGTLEKTSIANLYAGCCQRISLSGLAEFSALLDGLESHQAMLYGVPKGRQEARLVTEAERANHPDAISRTRQCFEFPQGPAIWMLDYDPPGDHQPLTPEELIATARGLARCLDKVPLLWRASVSSGIASEDGRITEGISGQRIYIPVVDARLIPEAGQALLDLLWARGHGYIKIGKAGQALERTLVDASVWQPERLDFAAPPVLGPGLTRNPPPARIDGTGGAWLDLRELIQAADGTVRSQATTARKSARLVMKPALTEAREVWVDATAPAIAQLQARPVEEVKATLRRACNHLLLTGDFPLVAADGSTPTVGELLDNPARWHNQRFADPLEPDYGDDPRIAWANLRPGRQPYLYSHAHGGRRFVLLRASAHVELRIGDRARVLDDVFEVLRGQGELYTLGEDAGLFRITEDARAVPVTPDWLGDHLDRTIRFYNLKPGLDATPDERPQDAPPWLAPRILAKFGEGRFPPLDAVITAPTLRRDGSLLVEPGYDRDARLLFVWDQPEPLLIPENPDLDQARAALDVLWAPFRHFPLVDPVDLGVVLQALLTAVVRPSLPTAPGVGLDAPAAGTGKTLLAKAIGALCLGYPPDILPPVGDKDDEVRKRLFSVLRDGRRVLLWDNVREPLGNPSLDAFLTASSFTDRVLGASQTASLPNRALFLVTGNNLRLLGDTCRRLLVARLDARVEKPYSREFDFCPLRMVLDQRPALVVAALTLERAWITAGRPRHGRGSTGSFETWDSLVRQTVCWIATWDDRFADPLLATDRAFEQDNDTAKLSALLEALDNLYAETPFTVAELIDRVGPASRGITLPPSLQALFEVLIELAGERGVINPRILGGWLGRHRDRRHGGRWLINGKLRHGSKTWQLQHEAGWGGLGGLGGLFSAATETRAGQVTF